MENKENLESELEKCIDYLRDNEIDIKVYQKDRLLYEYDHRCATKYFNPLYGELQEHLSIVDRFNYLLYLLERK